MYRFEVTADGVTGACADRLPLDCQRPPQCEGERRWTLGQSGCLLEPGLHNFSGVSFSDSRPARVDLSVTLDGVPIGAGSFMPTYVVSRPNGPDCDTECRTAPQAPLTLQ